MLELAADEHTVALVDERLVRVRVGVRAGVEVGARVRLLTSAFAL